MAPPRRPNDPPHRRGPDDRDPDDWDWGDEEWDEAPSGPPAPRARDSAREARRDPARGAEGDSAREARRDPARGTEGEATRADGDHEAEWDEWEDEADASGLAGSLAAGRAPSRAPASSGTRTSGGGPDGSRRTAGSTGGRAAALRRRRLLAGAGTLVLLLVAILVVSSISSGDDDDRIASVPLLSGPMAAAASQSVDYLGRVDAVRRFAELGQPIYCGGGKKPWVALTYDDGPGALSPKWISLLSKEQVPVTSFRVGTAVAGNERYLEVQRNLGWDNGTHTQSHPDLTKLSEDEQRREILAGIDASARVLGRKPELFRPPYQAHDQTTDRILKDLGQVQVLWNVDTEDSLGPTTVDKIVKNAVEGLRPGSIILMHEIKDQTYKAMPAIIKAMRERNLQPVTISQMLAGDPPSEEQVRKGYAGCITQEAAGPGEANRPGEVGGSEAT